MATKATNCWSVLTADYGTSELTATIEHEQKNELRYELISSSLGKFQVRISMATMGLLSRVDSSWGFTFGTIPSRGRLQE